jgi:hypothetical protein
MALYVCTNYFNVHKLWIFVHMVHLRVSYDSQIIERLFSYAEFSDLSCNVFSEV